MARINLEPYKGVRDFYPEDDRLHKYIFKTWEKVVESYGYESFNSSVLEPLELYKAKSSEEIINEQIYSFKDRGDRDVALRPEMTPTAARMVAGKWQELPAPVRWYSIPNLFRYEKPQRGRLREHWQLNVDIFGIKESSADVEIISIAHKIMSSFGAKDENYEIRINSRHIMDDLYKKIEIKEEERLQISRIIDKKDKISREAFSEAMLQVISEEKLNKLSYVIDSGDNFFEEFKNNASIKNLKGILETLKDKGISNLKFHPTLTRGFDYYTGMIFEIFDTNEENPRSLFGGGRYDNLIGDLSGENVPAVGFGMGDVTIQNFLETHELLPNLHSSTDVWLSVAPETDIGEVEKVAESLREKGLNIGVDISGKKLVDQLKTIEKRNIPFLIIVGKDELEKNKFKLRNTETREEKETNLEGIANLIPHLFEPEGISEPERP